LNKYSQTSILLLVCLLLAACFRHQSDAPDVKEERGGRKAEVTGSVNGSGKASQPETAKGQSSATEARNYERLQGYTFLVPDKWDVVPPEHFHDMPDTWEIVPLPPVRALYVAFKDQNRRKARLCFQTVQDDKNTLEPNLFEQLESEGSKSERWLIERLQVDTVKLIESAHTKVNAFDILWLHFTYSSSYEKGDVVMKFFYKEGSALSVIGTFSSPLYSELQKDITAVLDSIKKE
jgi:hypothetical protein